MTKKTVSRETRLHVARSQCEQEVMKLPGVNMVSEGELHGKPCLVVYLEADNENLRRKIRSDYDGFPVKVEVAGRIKAL